MTKNSISLLGSLAGFLLILGLILALLGPRYLGLKVMDDGLFRLAENLLPAEKTPRDLLQVSLDSNPLADADKVKQLRSFLRKAHRAQAGSINLLLAPLPLADWHKPEPPKKSSARKSTSEDEPGWESTDGEISKLAWQLEHYHVNLGYPIRSGETGLFRSPDMRTEPGRPEKLIQSAQLLAPQPAQFQLLSPLTGFNVLPLAMHPVMRQPLVWQNRQSRAYVPDLSLVAYADYRKHASLKWRAGESVSLETESIRAGVDGRVYGYFHANNIKVDTISLEQALEMASLKLRHRVILIGENSPVMQQLSWQLANLMAARTYATPWWNCLILVPVLILILLLALKLIPRLHSQTSHLLVALVLLGLFVVQSGLLLTRGIWPAFASVYAYVLFTHLVVLGWRSSANKTRQLKQASAQAWQQLADMEIQHGNHDDAMKHYLLCIPNDEVIENLYNIGLAFERRRQYEKALQLYSELTLRRKNYKDVDKRLKSLTNVSGTKTEILTPGQTTKTLVMPEMDLQLPVLGRYELERELGRGAMGVVYLGKDPKINRQVAIKTLDYGQFDAKELKSIRSRFFREAEAAGRLSHPSIVTVYDVGDEDDFAFIAMDYVKGVALNEHTNVDHLLPIAEVYRIIADVAETLDYAHSQNIVHRDIKPGNIMYNPDNGQIKITDFGIARITDNVRTRTGSLMGSPSYMAPEQMTGSHVDGHADIYALGVSFYQLLTGALPFDADSLGNLAYKITHEKHRPIRDVRPELPASATRIVNKAMQKKPEQRFSSGLEMAEAIRKAMPKGN